MRASRCLALAIAACALACVAAAEHWDTVSLLQMQQVTSARQARPSRGAKHLGPGGTQISRVLDHNRPMVWRHRDYNLPSANDSLHLLQAGVKHGDEKWRCAPIAKNFDGIYQVEGVCGELRYNTSHDTRQWYPGSPSEALVDIPVLQLKKEAGGQDLFGVFGEFNDWINSGSWFDPSYSNYTRLKENFITSQGTEYPDPVEMTFKWDGHEIHTRQDQICQTGDDPYCFANGWLKNQNPDLNPATLNDFDAYDNFTKEQCREMNEKYDFDSENMTMRSHIMETNSMYELSDNACDLMDTKGPLPTDRDFAKHAYFKCLMNDAHVEVAYCYFRGCVLENNRIGHGNECDY